MSWRKSVLPVLLLLLCRFSAAESTEAEVQLQSQLTAAKEQISKLIAERDAALGQSQAAENAKVQALQAADLNKKATDELALKIKHLEKDLGQATARTQDLEAQLAQGHSAAASVAQENEQLKAQVSALTQAQSTAASIAQENEQLKAQVSTVTQAQAAALKQFQESKQSEHALQAQLESSAARMRSLEQKLSESEQNAAKSAQESLRNLGAELKQARQDAASSKEMQQLLKQAQDAWLPLWMQYRVFQTQQAIVQLLEDLKGGRHGPIGTRLHSFLDVANEHATKALLSVKPHVDKGYAAASFHAEKAYAAAKPHVEDGLSKGSVALEKVLVNLEAFWKKYITDAEWMHELKATSARVEAELVREVSKMMNDIPALKPYSDPVTVQLLVYAILLLAVLIILVPVLALTCSRSAPAKESHKRKPEKAGKPSTHGHGHAKRSKRV